MRLNFLGAFVLAFILAPVVFILTVALGSLADFGSWMTTVQHTLYGTVPETALVTVLSGAMSTLWGLACAKLITRYKFFGRRIFSLSILSLLVFPSWFLAAVYEHTELADKLGVLPSYIFVQTIACLPVSYLIFRAALKRIPNAFTEVAATLGASKVTRTIFLHAALLSLPILATFLIGAASALSDIESAERLGLHTLSLSLNEIWMGAQRNDIAAILSSIIALGCLACIAPAVIFSTRNLRRNPSNLEHIHSQAKLHTPRFAGAFSLGAFVFVAFTLGFPTVTSLLWMAERLPRVHFESLAGDLSSSLITSITTVVLTLVLAFFVMVSMRHRSTSRWMERALWLSLLNYLLPPLIIAFAFFVATGSTGILGSYLPSFRETSIGISLASAIRFAPLLVLPVLDAIERSAPSLTECARTLGCSHYTAIRRVSLPLLMPAFAAGVSLVFIESMKEVVLSQALAPFGFISLATRIAGFTRLHLDKDAAVWLFILAILLFYPIQKIQAYIEDERN